MPRGKAGKRSAAEVHTHMTIAIDGYEASVSASVNHLAYEPQYAWQDPDDEPVYQFQNRLVVSGTVVSPEHRSKDRCVVTFYGGDSPPHDLDARLEDIAQLDEHRVPRYRMYRGREVPIYRPPRGLESHEQHKPLLKRPTQYVEAQLRRARC